MMADGASSPAYEQFCLLAKSQRGRAIVQLIQQVLNKEKIYVFGELLGLESVQALKDSEFKEHYRLLELFCYGNYSEYQKNRDQYTELSKKMVVKLRQLSIVSLAHKSKRVTYAALQEELDISNVRELEDLVIDTVYAGLLDGRLDQASSVLNVKSAMARDVRPGEVTSMITKLKGWGAEIEALARALDASMLSVRNERDAEVAKRKQVGKCQGNFGDRILQSNF